MKIVLFCKRAYSFSILFPIQEFCRTTGDEVLWYIDSDILEGFPHKNDTDYTTSIQDIYDFKSDVIFVPGNVVPHYLRGLKVQVFHGLAGEKKGHFRIRNYFDLYLTQGPYFTDRFQELAKKHKDFSVVETGWSKLDALYGNQHLYDAEKQKLLKDHKAKKIVLYAPTFSPSLTSAQVLYDQIDALAQNPDYLVLVKFHDLMLKETKERYVARSAKLPNLVVVQDPNILKYLLLSDLMISDTSSVVYEFLLLDKPVITFNSSSEHIHWPNLKEPELLQSTVREVFAKDKGASDRRWIIDNYHPYSDGLSAARMVKAVKDVLSTRAVPECRKLSLLRRWKVNKKYGKVRAK